MPRRVGFAVCHLRFPPPQTLSPESGLLPENGAGNQYDAAEEVHG